MSQDAIQIRGQLSEHAQVGYLPNTNPPEATLVIRIQPERGMPYVAVQRLGSDPAAHIAAQAKLHLMRRGTWVCIYARSLQVRQDHDTHALRVDGITSVIPFTNPAIRNEPAHADTQQEA